MPPVGYETPEGWEPGQPLTLETSLGRAIFNEALPGNYAYVNGEVGKKQLGVIVNDLAERYTKVEVAHGARRAQGHRFLLGHSLGCDHLHRGRRHA